MEARARRRLSFASVCGLCAAGIVYALLAIAGRGLLHDPDTFWHIATGRWMFAHHAVPVSDVFSHTLPGRPWITHEWLSEALFALSFDAFGWTGVIALTAAAAAAAFGLLMRALARVVPLSAAAIATALSFLLVAAHLSARPHVIAMPVLVAWVAALVTARAESRAPSLRTVALMTLWSNLHGGFVIGLGVAGILAIDAVLAAGAGERKIAAVRWARFLAAAAAASLVTPHGIDGWLFPFQLTSMSFALSFVTEWQRPDYSRLQPIELWLGAFALLVAIKRVRIPPARWMLIAALVAMALARVRHAELVALIAPLVLLEPIGRALGNPGTIADRARRYAMLAAGVIAVTSTRAAIGGADPDANPRIAPRAALAEVTRRGIAGPVFNDYDFGGYLIFSGVPVFVDGRVDFYGDAFMRDYARALDGDPAMLATLLERYHVTWTLLAASTPAAAVLDRTPGWRLIYADSSTKVHFLAP